MKTTMIIVASIVSFFVGVARCCNIGIRERRHCKI
jgi:hypothetical protein